MEDSIADLVAVDNVLVEEDMYSHYITVSFPANTTLSKTIQLTIMEIDFSVSSYDLTFLSNELIVRGIIPCSMVIVSILLINYSVATAKLTNTLHSSFTFSTQVQVTETAWNKIDIDNCIRICTFNMF